MEYVWTEDEKEHVGKYPESSRLPPRPLSIAGVTKPSKNESLKFINIIKSHVQLYIYKKLCAAAVVVE